MRGPPIAIVAAAAVLGGIVGCKFDEVTVPVGRERPVVHAVLRTRQLRLDKEYVVLLERTLTGRVSVDPDAEVDPADPILTGGGLPITGAVVVLQSGLDTTVGIEDVTVAARGGKGAGVYRFINTGKFCSPIRCPPPNSFPVEGGETIRLSISTPAGERITGMTTVPQTFTPFDTIGLRTFDREGDTLRLEWSPVELTERYALQISSPRGIFEVFSDASSIRLPGTLRNIFIRDSPSVFIAGFQQVINIAAVDSNYFDYFRSRNDPFTGTGIINHLQGATGVFGVYVPLQSRTFEIIAPIDEPLEGDYISRGPALVNDRLRLYVESRGGARTGLSGYTTTFDPQTGTSRFSILGSVTGSRMTLGVLRSQRITDTAYVFTLEARGDSLVGTVSGERGDGAIVLEKQ